MFLVYDESGAGRGLVAMDKVLEIIIGKPMVADSDDMAIKPSVAKDSCLTILPNAD